MNKGPQMSANGGGWRMIGAGQWERSGDGRGLELIGGWDEMR